MNKMNDDLLGLNGNDGEALLFSPSLHDGLHRVLGAAGRLQLSPQLRGLCILGQKGKNIICNALQTISGSEKQETDFSLHNLNVTYMPAEVRARVTPVTSN